MLVPFVKQDAVNPCLVPSKAAFTDPIRKSKVAWEEKDVFNPAAVVRNNKVVSFIQGAGRDRSACRNFENWIGI